MIGPELAEVQAPTAMPKSSPAALIAIVGLLVGACSQTDPAVYAGANQPRVVPDGQSLTVVNVDSTAAALPWATEYCGKLGKVPGTPETMLFHSHHRTWNSVTFHCSEGQPAVRSS
jgi:hypothetical protein